MKKHISTILTLAVIPALLFLSSCDKSEDTEGTTYFEFTEKAFEISPNGETEVEIEWERKLKRAATLELYTSTAGIDEAKVAKEGVDFSIETTVEFDKEDEKQSVVINILGSDYAGKSFWLGMKSSDATDVGLGKPSGNTATGICLITLVADSAE